MPLSETAKKRLKEIAIELKKIRKLFGEYHSWKDNETQKILFPPGRNFNYDEMVEKECELLIERISIKEPEQSTEAGCHDCTLPTKSL